MAVCCDELENNEFLRLLQVKYAEKFVLAQSKMWMICAPCQSSLVGVHITPDFVDNHVLKPSPFFKSNYTTTDSRCTRNYEFDDNGVIKNSEGGKIKILTEEIGYNKEYKPFKILIIERPLTCNQQAKTDISNGNSICYTGVGTSLPLDWKKLLKMYPEAVLLIDKKIKQFCSSYMVLPDYLCDVAVKLQGMVQSAIEVFAETAQVGVSQCEIAASVEFYILSRVHSKIYPVVKKKFADEDKELTHRLLSLYEAHLTPDQLGIKEQFCCHTPSAVVELASLNLKTSPMEKLFCVVNTMELLNQDIDKSLHETYSAVNLDNDVPHLSSDDLIPLMVYLIVQSRPLYLASNLFYIQNFCWYFSKKDRFSFSIATFQAAKEFLRSNATSFLKPSSGRVKKEMSLEELMTVTVELHKNSIHENSSAKPQQTKSTIDRQLQNVTKMIEASTIELREWTEPKYFRDSYM